MVLCRRCRAELDLLYEVARAKGYKAGFLEGFEVFRKEISNAVAMRPQVMIVHKDGTMEVKDDGVR